jgi:tetratricopeptide (TPR) repeat protein
MHEHEHELNEGVTQAENLIAENRHQQALELLRRVQAERGLTVDMDVARAWAHVGLEQFRRARETTQTLLDKGGDEVRPQALLLQTHIVRRSSRYLEDALEAAHDAIELAQRRGLDDVLARAHVEAARIYAIKECPQLSAGHIAAAHELTPDDPQVWYHSAIASMGLDDRPAAKKALERIEGDKAYWRSVGLAYLEYVMGQFDTAHEHLDAIEPLGPNDVWPRRMRCQILAAQARWEDAIASFDALRVASPHADSLPRDLYERACCLYRAGRLEQAAASAAELAAETPEGHYVKRLAGRMARLLNHPEAGSRPRRRLKEFPSVTQLRDHCGPASTELYLRYFGLTEDQVEIARAIKKPDGGTPVYKMRRYLEEAGFEARRIEAELPKLKRLIDAGIPVIMEESYSSSTHVAVAIGYDDARELLEVQDPMTHQVRETLYEDLAGLRNLSNHGAVVGVPASDAGLVAALDAAGATECEYISLVDRAWKALDDDQPEEGDRLVEQSIELHREYELAWMYKFRRARSRLQETGASEARVEMHQVLGEITALWPDDEWPQQLLGQALFHDKRTSEALVAFERARDRDPGDPYNWSMIADCHLRLNNQSEAFDALVEALGRDPGYTRANENLADLCMRRKRMTLAWALNAVARERGKDNEFNFAIHGQLLAGDSRFDEALAAYDRGLELDPEREWIMELRAKLLGRMDRVDDAITQWESLIESSDYVGYRFDLADMLYNKGRSEKAIEVCDALLAEDDAAAPAYAIKGASQGALGQLEEAMANFRRALELRPTYSWVFAEKGKLLLGQEKHLDAVQSFAAAVGLSGADPRHEFLLGDALVAAGHADRGAGYMRNAAIYGTLGESELVQVGKLMVDTRGGRAADELFYDVAKKRGQALSVLRAHATTLLHTMWAPRAAEPVLAQIYELDREDPFALAYAGENAMLASLDREAEGEALFRRALEKAPEQVFARRIFADALVDRGRFADALEVLEPLPPGFMTDRLRVKALLGLGRDDDAEGVVAEFRRTYEEEGRACVGAMQMEYIIARRRWDWRTALELAEGISREMHERDDDGRLDRWEEERFECMARLGEIERAKRFGESQAVDAASLGRLAYTAYRAEQMALAEHMAQRALRLDPDETQALAVTAYARELEGDIEAAVDVWRHLGRVDEDWHVWQEQLGRLALGGGDVERGLEHAEAALALGHLCPWAFAVRGQARLLGGDRTGAVADFEQAWMRAKPEDRDHQAHDVWAVRAALAGDGDEAERCFAEFMKGNISDNDTQRVRRLREAL